MAKSKAKSTHKKQQHSKTLTDIKKSQGESPFEKYQDYIYIGIIVLAILIFFGDGIFGGKIFASPDNLSPYSFKTFLEDAKANGIFPLWLPYIFGGMPSLASLTMSLPASNNFFSFIYCMFFKLYRMVDVCCITFCNFKSIDLMTAIHEN